jgi:AmmeMemoRadiSam system protein B
MLVFAGFTPNSPLLLPEINKDRLAAVEKTRAAIQELADELYAAKPDTIVIITDHPTRYREAFCLSVSDPYKFDLKEFGHLSFDRTFRPDIMLIDRLQRSLRRVAQPITMSSDEALHYASAVPLSILAAKLPKVALVPIGYSELDAKAHFAFGQAIKDAIMDSAKRVAVIAAGDMSHTLTLQSPAPLHGDGQIFDDKIKEVIATKNTAGLLTIESSVVQNAQQLSYQPLTILFGLLDHVAVTPTILSYEAPFGVGYLVANFIIK